MTTVACVLRSGGIYHAGHVTRLYRACVEHFPRMTRFVCLTDNPGIAYHTAMIDCVPLRHDWPGWWSKIELFRPGLFVGPVIYIDLDSLVIDDLAPLVMKNGGLRMVPDFMGPPQVIWNSSVMSWSNSDLAPIYDRFAADPAPIMSRLHGDQNWIAEASNRPISAINREHVLSYKVDCRGLYAPPQNARIVTFHGEPKPEDCWEKWIKERI